MYNASSIHPEDGSPWLIELARSSLKLCTLALSLNSRGLRRRRIRPIESCVISCITRKNFENNGTVALPIVTGRGSLGLIAVRDVFFSSSQILSENSPFK